MFYIKNFGFQNSTKIKARHLSNHNVHSNPTITVQGYQQNASPKSTLQPFYPKSSEYILSWLVSFLYSLLRSNGTPGNAGQGWLLDRPPGQRPKNMRHMTFKSTLMTHNNYYRFFQEFSKLHLFIIIKINILMLTSFSLVAGTVHGYRAPGLFRAPTTSGSNICTGLSLCRRLKARYSSQ